MGGRIQWATFSSTLESFGKEHQWQESTSSPIGSKKEAPKRLSRYGSMRRDVTGILKTARVWQWLLRQHCPEGKYRMHVDEKCKTNK
ncbi:Hypothetical predicted protein [Podarcis lilfordi]|uniref:Uncharacterized protein n=1 Tax=Podarcis lilfordi TaxID=74358 RepID=A0AA35KLT8_9SAUR|nr:Hypothetical predicted protein [Podarcis lilfordi]